MDRHTKAIYKRGAIVVLPILAIVGCRVGLRACVAIDRSERSHRVDDVLARQAAERREAELAAAAATSEATQRARARQIPTAAPGNGTAPIATGQQVPDALAVDEQNVAWLATRSGDVVVASRSGDGPRTPRIVAKDQKLPQRRHVQGLALAGGYVYWITTTRSNEAEEDGAILRVKLSGDAAEPEVVASGLGGLSALLVDKDSVYYARGLRVSREEDGGATGGVYRIKLGPKAKPAKDAQLLFPAERPCAIAVDEAAVYGVEPLKLWRAPKGKGEAKVLVSGAERLGCTVAVDPEFVYWTIPGEDSVMRAKKTDGASVGVVAFARKRPTNVVVDKNYAYVLTETSPQALGELGSIFKVSLRGELTIPKALVTDQAGLGSVAALGDLVVFSGFNDAENDGIVSAIAPEASPYKRGQ